MNGESRPKAAPADPIEGHHEDSTTEAPMGTCASCGGPIYLLLDGYDACRTCGVEFNPGRRLGEVLEDIMRMLTEYVVLPNAHEADAVALWVVQTHLLNAFDVVMFLHIFSPEPESGKTRLLEVLSKLVRIPWLISRPTAATLFRMIEERQPTLLWDEIDRVFSVKQIDASTADLQAVVNSGHKRGAVVPRCVGEGKNLKVKDFPVFTSMAFAGINQLKLPDTVRSRSIPIALRRRAPDEPVRRWREREANASAAPIVAKLESLVISLTGPLREARPTIPEDLGDRAADGWEGLLAISEAAGGDWPKRAREAARALNGLGRGLDATTIGVQLLGDIEAIFTEKGVDRIFSSDLVAALHRVEESSWDWMTVNALAKKLRGFPVKPHNVRIGEKQAKGYALEDFGDAFRRYLQMAVPAVPNVPPQAGVTSSGTVGTPATGSREKGEADETGDGLRATVPDVRSDAGGELPSGSATGQRARAGDEKHPPSSTPVREHPPASGVGPGASDEGPARRGVDGLDAYQGDGQQGVDDADDPATEMLVALHRETRGNWNRIARIISDAGFRSPAGEPWTGPQVRAAFGTRMAEHLAKQAEPMSSDG